ncbi:MAG: ferrochelatase [Cellvibrionales bacterium]|nr:ferrochelatase [Cellvibrionales bacterium]
MKPHTALLICNLGTPEAPTKQAVRAFLKPFLSDPRVVEVPRPLWWCILNGFILPFRPKSIAKNYQALFDQYGESPLRLYTQSQVKKLSLCLKDKGVVVDYAFTYGEPSIKSQLSKYQDLVDKIVLLPLYPQYSCATTSSIYDQVSTFQLKQRECLDIHIIKDYYRKPLYQAALANSVKQFWEKAGQGEHLVVSFHGVPERYREKGDPYYQQCLETAKALVLNLGLSSDQYTVSFQSRLGRAKWLTPYTDEIVKSLAMTNKKIIDVICPSFAVDCLETLEEIAIENKGYFTEKGGESLRLIPCLNDSDDHIQMIIDSVLPFVAKASE